MESNLIMSIKNNEIIGHSTDTVFGLVVKVEKENIRKLNSIKKRQSDQPLQILFNDIDEVLKIIEPSEFVIDYVRKKIDNKTSYMVRVKKEFSDKYLLNSFKNIIMFRIPKGEINELLNEVKMLFATSANSTGKKPVLNKEEFKREFPSLKSYGEEVSNQSSKIINLTNDKEEIIRE